jgi:hypothetical protein
MATAQPEKLLIVWTSSVRRSVESRRRGRICEKKSFKSANTRQKG